MKWYLKALVQNVVDALPDLIAQPLYYQMQTRLGELRAPRYRMRFDAAIDFARLLSEDRGGVAGKRFLEIGTGRTVDVPMALWLMGAGEVVSIDIAPLLRPELVEGAVDEFTAHWHDHYRPALSRHADPATVDARYDQLCRMCAGGVTANNLPRLLKAMCIDHRAPADATRLRVREASFDVVVTFVVLQHVPREPMEAIMQASRGMLKKTGYQIHVANTGDHFAHADASLSPLHFLRWSESQWDRIAGNKFMYQNRMRADDYYDVFRGAGLSVAKSEERIDERALADLHAGLELHPDWQGREPERDAVIRFTAVLQRDDAPGAAQAV
jgi:SAM-dependent methyltransferase